LPKLEVLKDIGVTRLSLGIENFDDGILEANGRAHLSAEIHRAYEWARAVDFPQINIDLIAGMIGETWEKWRQTVQKTVALAPDSVTVYQMELPFNTVISKELQQGTFAPSPQSIADWPTKRAWVRHAFDELGRAGYQVSSAYTMVKEPARCQFVYRDALWHGADMFGTGVASFGHVNGVHMQNVDRWETYIETVAAGNLPLGRALPVAPEELFIREWILQLKAGRVEFAYFREKFGFDPAERFADVLERFNHHGWARSRKWGVELTSLGLLEIDRHLPEFFLPEHRVSRYT
jgi:oxygen-independent coproporphyrinogen-3 oxidase